MNLNLNTAKALLGAAVVAGTITAVSQPASAITFNTGGTTVAGQGQISSKSGVTTIDFNDGVNPGIGGTVVNGSSPNLYAAPPGDTSNYLTVGSFATPEFATFNLGVVPKGYFGLYIGSLDAYNSIEFFLNGVSKKLFGSKIVGGNTIQGEALSTDLSGDQMKGEYFNFFGENNGDLFDTVVLGSSQKAFEVDNIAYRDKIPTPALLPGLIGLGVAALRKRKQNQQSEAEA